MTTLSTNEENAQKVLHVFSHFKAVPGRILTANYFVAVGSRKRWEMEDLQQGIDFASAQGWVMEKDEGIELTKQGFKKMQHDMRS